MMHLENALDAVLQYYYQKKNSKKNIFGSP